MPELVQFFQILLDTFTLFVLLVGLIGLVVPVFPGLVIMWLGTLVYALLQSSAGAMTTWDWVVFGIITLLMIAAGRGNDDMVKLLLSLARPTAGRSSTEPVNSPSAA